MRHSRPGTTLGIYAQSVSEAQHRAVARTMEMLHQRESQAAVLN